MMKKDTLFRTAQLVLDNYDMPHNQEAWFELEEYILEMALLIAETKGCAGELAEKFPMFFKSN